MLNLYDPETSPSTVVVKLVSSRRSRGKAHPTAAHYTQSQVLFLMEPTADRSAGGAGVCETQAIRRAA